MKSQLACPRMAAWEQVDVLLLLRPREFAAEEPLLDGRQGIGVVGQLEDVFNEMRCLKATFSCTELVGCRQIQCSADRSTVAFRLYLVIIVQSLTN